jgi:hypothetical protein
LGQAQGEPIIKFRLHKARSIAVVAAALGLNSISRHSANDDASEGYKKSVLAAASCRKLVCQALMHPVRGGQQPVVVAKSADQL